MKSREENQLKVLDLGLIKYRDAWSIQKTAQRALINNENLEDLLIFCEHYPVITLGKSGKADHLILKKEELLKRGIEFYQVERGGDITYHGPGQLVVYPILNLYRYKTDVNWYLRALEEIIILLLKKYGVEGIRVEKKTGVWVSGRKELKKIASIGVRLSRWRTMHGLAINITAQPNFNLIIPCGIKGCRVTSFEEEIGALPDIREIKDNFLSAFCSVFNCTVLNKDLNKERSSFQSGFSL
ncbi:MAG: lipoyl(octanoyl) transferase LipB [Candidatus Dadabacteria bacterium]|nr:MAG: lipoyl(octanoyl) transferase LipB [Candidatus Dadabacteria bacterium]